MLSIAREFLILNGGDRAAAAKDFADGLMAGDAATFKAGYTAENAAIATAEAMKLSATEVGALCDELDIEDRSIVGKCLGVALFKCGCGATTTGECAAAVEGYFTSLGQRSDVELLEMALDGECEAAKVVLAEREKAIGGAA